MTQLTENQRVKKIISDLRGRDIIKTDAEVAIAMGYSRSTISEILNGSAGVSRKFIDKLAAVYHINPLFITEGKQPMFLVSTNGQSPSTQPDQSQVGYQRMGDRTFMTVPLVNQYAYAGYASGYADPEYLEELPKVPFIVDKEYKGSYMCFEIRGDSMTDGSVESYLPGDLALCRQIQRAHWVNKLHIHRWDFIIMHRTEGLLLKRIIDHDTDKGIVRLHSLNPLYQDFDIQLDEVEQLFNVVKIERKR